MMNGIIFIIFLPYTEQTTVTAKVNSAQTRQRMEFVFIV